MFSCSYFTSLSPSLHVLILKYGSSSSSLAGVRTRRVYEVLYPFPLLSLLLLFSRAYNLRYTSFAYSWKKNGSLTLLLVYQIAMHEVLSWVKVFTQHGAACRTEQALLSGSASVLVRSSTCPVGPAHRHQIKPAWIGYNLENYNMQQYVGVSLGAFPTVLKLKKNKTAGVYCSMHVN